MNKYIKMIIAVVIIVLTVVISMFLIKHIFYPKTYSNIISSVCDKYEIDDNLVYAIIKTESNFDEKAISKAEAKGLMQVMDKTAEEISKKIGIEEFEIGMLYDPQINIEIGTYYIKELYNKYQDYVIAVIAYNAGQGNVDKWIEEGIITKESIKTIPYKETNSYLKKVLREYSVYNKIYK